MGGKKDTNRVYMSMDDREGKGEREKKKKTSDDRWMSH